MAGEEGSSKVTRGCMAIVRSSDFILNVTEIHQVSKSHHFHLLWSRVKGRQVTKHLRCEYLGGSLAAQMMRITHNILTINSRKSSLNIFNDLNELIQNVLQFGLTREGTQKGSKSKDNI